MADDLRIQVDGLRELTKSLRAVDRTLPRELTAIHKRIAQPIATRANQTVPRRTGRLAGSIRPLGSQRSAQVAAGRKNIPYAGVIHFGWPRHNIDPQPFLFTAIEAEHEETVVNYQREIETFLDRVWETI